MTDRERLIELIDKDYIFAEDIADHLLANGVCVSKAEAIKEFAERLKEKAHTTPVFDSYCSKTYMGNVLKVYVADIDNLVKEMVGDVNDT